MSIRDDDLEAEIKSKGLTFPRVTLESINNKIVDIEIVKHITKSGSVLRWGVINMENGFSITGSPSASVSPKNDNQEIGEKIAINNAKNRISELEGYLLKQTLFERNKA